MNEPIPLPDLADVALLERAALNAVPAPRVAWDGPFVLRAFLGGTGRANAACSLDPSPDPGLEARIGRVEAFHARHGLAARFRSTPLDPPGLASRLLDRGYREAEGALVMTASIPGTEDRAARWLEGPEADWLSVLGTAEYQGAARRAEKEGAVPLMPLPATWLVLMEEGQAAACGHAVADGELCGIFDLATRPEFQRRGLGRRLLESLSAWGQARGTTRCWLQVGPKNEAARRVYEKAGFRTVYEYRYFLKDQA